MWELVAICLLASFGGVTVGGLVVGIVMIITGNDFESK